MIISCEDSAVIASGTKKRKSQIYSTEMELELRKEVILSSLELPYDEDGDFDLCRHESNCLGILRMVFQPDENAKSSFWGTITIVEGPSNTVKVSFEGKATKFCPFAAGNAINVIKS